MTTVTWKPIRMVVDDSIIDRGDVREIIDPVWQSANIYETVKAYEYSLARFSHEQRLVHAIVWYDAEVENGGHHQFFLNPTGIVWKDALSGLEAIGLDEDVAVLKAAVQRFGSEPSLDHATRNGQLADSGATFDGVDEEYYGFTRDDCQKTLDYIKKRPRKVLFRRRNLPTRE